MKNFKAKKMLIKDDSITEETTCDCCNQVKDCIVVTTKYELGSLICLDCLQYEKEKDNETM